MNNSKVSLIASLSLAMTLAMPATAQIMVYPAKGQSPKQIEQDKYQCYGWAKNNTGFDPMQAGSTTAPAQQSSQGGGLLRGGARGAAVGAVGGAIGGDAGKGAAIGAATGAMLGGFRRRNSHRQQEQAKAQAQQNSNAARNDYNRAFAACLEGRGYSVK